MENLKPNLKVKYKDRNIQKSKSLHIYVESYVDVCSLARWNFHYGLLRNSETLHVNIQCINGISYPTTLRGGVLRIYATFIWNIWKFVYDNIYKIWVSRKIMYMTCCFTNSVRLTYVEFKIKRVSKIMCIVELV